MTLIIRLDATPFSAPRLQSQIEERRARHLPHPSAGTFGFAWWRWLPYVRLHFSALRRDHCLSFSLVRLRFGVWYKLQVQGGGGEEGGLG